jgi:hypothetical protein
MYVLMLLLTIPLYACWYLVIFVVSIVLVGYFQGHAVKRKCLKAANTQSYQNVNRLWNNWSSCDFGWIQYLFYYLEAVFRTWAPITDRCIITWGRHLERGREGGNPINVCDAWQCNSVLSFVSSVLFPCKCETSQLHIRKFPHIGGGQGRKPN